jgi:hypothetical protein
MYQAHTSTETNNTPMKTSMKIIRSVGLMLSSRLGSLVADGAEALTAGIYGGHAGAELPPGMAGTWLGATVTLPLQGQQSSGTTSERTLLLLRQRPKIAAETATSSQVKSYIGFRMVVCCLCIDLT